MHAFGERVLERQAVPLQAGQAGQVALGPARAGSAGSRAAGRSGRRARSCPPPRALPTSGARSGRRRSRAAGRSAHAEQQPPPTAAGLQQVAPGDRCRSVPRRPGISSACRSLRIALVTRLKTPTASLANAARVDVPAVRADGDRAGAARVPARACSPERRARRHAPGGSRGFCAHARPTSRCDRSTSTAPD